MNVTTLETKDYEDRVAIRLLENKANLQGFGRKLQVLDSASSAE